MTTETYQKKVWRRPDGRFSWRVRVADRATFASGTALNRAEADQAIADAIDARELELRAAWKRVSA